MSSDGFFLGGQIDPASGDALDPRVEVHYDANDLTTHGVIVGMTGSGKTGLGVIFLEEALLAGIPTLVIDPKGDMTNLMLTFPDLAPADFEPWVDEGEARREDKTVGELADDKAQLWTRGLGSWGLGGDDIARLRSNAKFTVFTPGSSAGVPLDVIGSLAAPDDGDPEAVTDEIEGFVSGMLGLVGIEADPLASKEHILLSNVISHAWAQGEDLTLEGLIGRVHRPPMRKMGVFDLDAFFPEMERLQLAMRLNALVASPSFAGWRSGVPLDIQSMLWEEDGTPRASIIYLAHLSDDERQFVVTLLMSKMVTWMRSQSGSSDLRALIYMDEVFGFVPPTAMPPAKKPILTILKQARAFGVGMLLSTQNPVDLDYKAMSNAGTWAVGRLQTERDTARILEALQTASGEGDIDQIDSLVSGLGKRQFLLHNTRDTAPVVFGTRWAMSYLRGPLTRDEIGRITRDDPLHDTVVTAPEPPSASAPDGANAGADDATPIAPTVASGIPVHHLDPGAPWADEVGASRNGTNYEAALAIKVHLTFDDRYAGVDHAEEWEAIAHPLTDRFDATTLVAVDHDDRDFLDGPPGAATYVIPDAPIHEKAWFSSVQGAVSDHLRRNRSVEVFKNSTLKLYSRIGETREAFATRCNGVADDHADAEAAKIRDRFEDKMDDVRERIQDASRDIDEAEIELVARRQDEMLSGAGAILDVLLRGKKSTRSISASSRSAKRTAERKLRRAEADLTDKAEDLAELEDDLLEELTEIDERWRDKAADIETIEIGLEQNDIDIDEVALVWVPVR